MVWAAALLVAGIAQAAPLPTGGGAPAPRAVAAAPAAPAPPAADTPLLWERAFVRDRVEDDGTTVRTTESTVLARNPLGVSMLGQVGAMYLAENGTVTFEKVVIAKPDGRRVGVDASGAEDLNPFGMAGTIPSDIRFRRLTIPGLEAGDRLEYRIDVRTRPVYRGVVAGEMSFELDPGLAPRQEYELDLPAGRRVAVRLRDGFPGRLETVPGPADRIVRRLVREKPAATEAAPATADPDLLFTSFTSWAEVGQWWWTLARDRVVPDAAVRAETERVTAGKATPLERLLAIHAFVAGQIRYLSVSFGAGRMQPRKAADVLASRYGDCKDKHALVEAMAAAAGIEVRAVLVSAKQEDLHDDVPSPVQFDHVVSRATLEAGREVWLDSTASLAPPGYLMPTVRGERGVLVDEEKGGVVLRLPEALPYPTRFAVSAQGTLDAKGPLRARLAWSLRGDGEAEMRLAALAAPSAPVERRKELAKAMASEWTKGKFEDPRFGDPTKLDGPFTMEMDVEHTMGASTFEKPWDLWLPLPRVGLPVAKEGAGPDEVAARFASFDETALSFSCRLPEGMWARAPLAVKLDRPFAVYESTYTAEGGLLRVERRLALRAREVRGRDAPAYEAFRKAVEADHGQEFPIEAWKDASAPVDAGALHAQGYDAIEKGDAKKAEELLRQVIALEPRHKSAYNNLGRALRMQGREAEALALFDKQIEIDPYDEWSWANRGDALVALGRKAEGEKSYMKQIEVAPLNPWAYRSLAYLRAAEKRYADAADLYRRATSADPGNFETWVSLGWACLLAGQPGEGRAALDRARSLAKEPVTQGLAASVLTLGPDVAEAGRWAEETLPRLAEQLDGLAPARLGIEHLALTAALLEAWRVIGLAAVEKGDLARAERFLVPAWEAGLYPDAALALATLREKQGRPADARRMVAAGGSIPVPWNAAKDKLDSTVEDPSQRETLRAQGSADVMAHRIRTLPGAPAGALAVDVLVFVDAAGTVAAVRAIDPSKAAELSKVERRAIGARLPLGWPEGASHPYLRRASFACSTATPCSLVLDLVQRPSLTATP